MKTNHFESVPNPNHYSYLNPNHNSDCLALIRANQSALVIYRFTQGKSEALVNVWKQKN